MVRAFRLTAPAPLTLDVDVSVWPTKLRYAPAATANEPLVVPPPLRLSVPLCTCTAPELLKVTPP